jgi:peptide-methionine (S)-S-oxide reductase
MSTLASFGAGCFWGVEAAFRELAGVTDAAVGYMGGHHPHPTYRQVCTGTTGHAEVCQITFDPTRIGYEQLVEFFYQIHDPTTRNRQGPDIGTQYRSVIFYHDADQKRIAQAVTQRLAAAGIFRTPIVTAIEPAGTFWRAEEYHQQYFAKHNLPSCHRPRPLP